MIKVVVQYEAKIIRSVKVIGHANYDAYGKDIVCSAVSSIATTTINGILSIHSEAISYNYQEDTLEIIVNVDDTVTQKLLQNMIHLFEELSCSYSKNIMVQKEGYV